MKLNWAEWLVVNNPLRVLEQRVQIRWLKSRRPLPVSARVLEIGCGRGAGAALILKEFQPAVVHAFDLDIRMIRLGKRYLQPHQRQAVTLYVGDAVHLPYRDGSLDAVFGFGFLHHVPDWRGALAEVNRVLKTGGVYYMEELYPTLYANAITRRLLVHPRENRFSSDDLHRSLAEMHFRVEDILEMKWVGLLGVFSKVA